MGVGSAATTMRTPDHFLPSTFEDRGAAVPFTTPIFAYARVRKDYRNRLELLVSRFSDASGIYVLPWPAVREIGALTTHDVMLHEEVVNRDALTPHDIRLAALSVAKTGLAGPDAADAAEEALAADEEAKAINQVILILKVIEEVEKAAAKSLMREITKPEGQEKVRETLFAIADKLDIRPDLLDQRLSDLGTIIYSVGCAWNPTESRLRGIMARLKAFIEALLSWSEKHLGEAAGQARFCAEVAGLTAELAAKILEDLDAALVRPHDVVAAWATKKDEVETLATRLAWLLDGWDPICGIWTQGESGSEGDQAAALGEIVTLIPLIPRAELEGPKLGRMESMMGGNRRWVRIGEDWRSGELDGEMVQRFEALRSRP